MLASRTLFWTEPGVFWECKALTRSEYKEEYGWFMGSPKHLQMSEVVIDIQGRQSLLKRKKPSEPPMLKKGLWSNILRDFFNRSLTNVTDKLPAVTGLGQEFARLPGSDYELGVFKHNLIQGLA